MKILVTSFMTLRPALPFSANFDAVLIGALRNLGHEVDVRRVRPTDDLSKYDRALVQLWELSSLSSRYSHGALWAMSQIPSITFVTDHNITGVLRSFPTPGAPDPSKKVLRELVGGVTRSDWRYWHLPDYAVPIVHAAQSVHARPMVTQNFSFPGLDPARVLTNGFTSVVPLDPSRLTPVPGYEGCEPRASTRERSWLFAALRAPKGIGGLANGCTWPIVRYGDRQSPIVPEDVITRMHLRHAGSLARPYDHAGSGWWRLRYLTAVSTCTPLIVARNEAPDSPFSDLAPCDVEQISGSDLDWLAARQCEYFYAHAWSIERFHQQLDDAITNVPDPLVCDTPLATPGEVQQCIRGLRPAAPSYIRTDEAHSGGVLDETTRARWYRFLSTGVWE
jgi:hypothetical protein